jgi:tetratricopeptide (TPR) repeat protein
LAQLCVKTGDIDRAEQILKKVCTLNPEFARAHKDLGVIYLNKRLFDYAKDEFEKAYEIEPNNASIIVEYANYLHAVSEFEKADEYYKQALSLEPDNASALAFSALNKTHLQQIDEAKEQISKVLDRISNSAFLLYIAGRIYHLAKDYETAKMYLIKSYEMEQLPEVQNLLGLCYFELGNYEQAKTIFLNMLEKVPTNINVILNIAKSCENLEENDTALKYAEDIVNICPECEEAQEIIRKLS